jgi:histidinol-phosphatase
MNADLTLALDLAEASDAITKKYFGLSTLEVKTKHDATPVSEADEAVEQMIRKVLAHERPNDAIVGEEFGATEGKRRWIIDPIDGTKNYIRGVPVWATLIALEEDGMITTGVVSAPRLDRRWWASRGEGSFRNGKRIRVSDTSTVADSFLGYDSITDFTQPGQEAKFIDLLRKVGRSRGLGDFWIHMLVAEGGLDAAIEPTVAHWDMAALQVIVEEAGGRFTTLDGRVDPSGGSVISSNGLIHDAMIEAMR